MGETPSEPDKPSRTTKSAAGDVSRFVTVVRKEAANTRQQFVKTETDLRGGMGSVGRLVGDQHHQSGNIATIAIIGLLVITGISIIGFLILAGRSKTMPEAEESIKTITLALIALMGTILGYLFGRGSR